MGLHEIRRRIQAVSQTRQITNAMYLISSTRMRKTMTHIEYIQEYYDRIRTTMKDILSKTYYIEKDYMTKHKENRAVFLVIASDKGLAGSYNTNVLNLALDMIQKYPDRYIVSIGLKAREFFDQHNISIDKEFIGIAQDPSLDWSRRIASYLMEMYDNHEADEIYIIGTHFIRSFVHEPRVTRFLPLDLDDYDDVDLEFEYNSAITYEPSPEAVLHTLVPQYAIGLIYDILSQSYASEQSARMNAMKTSMDNADDMLKKLNSDYNRIRQYAITQEIAELAGGLQFEESEDDL